MTKQTIFADNNRKPPIDPHFLYNTLDAINWMALDCKEYTISRMLTSLAATLRYTIHDSKEWIQIQDEIEYLRKFIYLQQQRFSYEFTCSITAQERTKQIRIPRMLIQPVLESVLDTGFPEKTGDIQICFQTIEDRREESLKIAMEVNGLKPVGTEAVREIEERIEETYGTDTGCSVKVQANARKIEIVIPLQKKKAGE